MTEEVFDSVYALNVERRTSRRELAPLMAKRQRGNRQCIDDGRRLRGGWHEPLWIEQGRHQPADKAWEAENSERCPRQCSTPGPTRTEGTDAMGRGLGNWLPSAGGPSGYSGRDCRAIVFLATDRASFIHGAKLAVMEGYGHLVLAAKLVFAW
jgi:hypothetical protein